ncbi:hypothetical protein Indivirus_3_29 [Indivirus ILV1]|uniref:Protein kinase domain-containing protein n=1 Tax=Indivirus ILV1 TaxID=1977633 RepID=A0A1V0SDH4_9VIRU|nr:hypothetical protein Indivirus_3_29 [Indivirus ILV1]
MEFNYRNTNYNSSTLDHTTIKSLFMNYYNIDLTDHYTKENIAGCDLYTYMPASYDNKNKKLFTITLFKILDQSSSKFDQYVYGIEESLNNVLMNFDDYYIRLYTDISILCQSALANLQELLKVLFKKLFDSKRIELSIYNCDIYAMEIDKYTCDNNLVVNKMHISTIGTVFRALPFFSDDVMECHCRDTDSTFGNKYEKRIIDLWLKHNNPYYLLKSNYRPSHFRYEKSKISFGILAAGLGGRRLPGRNTINENKSQLTEWIKKANIDAIQIRLQKELYDKYKIYNLDLFKDSNTPESIINVAKKYNMNIKITNYGVDELFLNEYFFSNISENDIYFHDVNMASDHIQIFSNPGITGRKIFVYGFLLRLFFEETPMNYNNEYYYLVSGLCTFFLNLVDLYPYSYDNKINEKHLDIYYNYLFREIMKYVGDQYNIYYSFEEFKKHVTNYYNNYSIKNNQYLKYYENSYAMKNMIKMPKNELIAKYSLLIPEIIQINELTGDDLVYFICILYCILEFRSNLLATVMPFSKKYNIKIYNIINGRLKNSLEKLGTSIERITDLIYLRSDKNNCRMNLIVKTDNDYNIKYTNCSINKDLSELIKNRNENPSAFDNLLLIPYVYEDISDKTRGMEQIEFSIIKYVYGEKIKDYKFNEITLINIFLKIYNLLMNLWKSKFIHGDINEDNIIIKDNIPYIIDWTLVTKIGSAVRLGKYNIHEDGKIWIDGAPTGYTGMIPIGAIADEHNDMYSLANTIESVINNQFSSNNTLKQNIKKLIESSKTIDTHDFMLLISKLDKIE